MPQIDWGPFNLGPLQFFPGNSVDAERSVSQYTTELSMYVCGLGWVVGYENGPMDNSDIP